VIADNVGDAAALARLIQESAEDVDVFLLDTATYTQIGYASWGGQRTFSAVQRVSSNAKWRLGPEKRTRTNGSELRRSIVCYPLRAERKSAFKQRARSG
jgi:hypothetical protein